MNGIQVHATTSTVPAWVLPVVLGFSLALEAHDRRPDPAPEAVLPVSPEECIQTCAASGVGVRSVTLDGCECSEHALVWS